MPRTLTDPTTGESLCRHCQTPTDDGGTCDCDGATVVLLTDLLAALRGRRPVTADDLAEADSWLDVAWLS